MTFTPGLGIDRLSVISWLTFLSLHDLRTWRVPAWSTWPLIALNCLALAVVGHWPPLALFVCLFLADTTVADVKGILRKEPVPEDGDRWLLPTWVTAILMVLILSVALHLGEASLVAAGMMALARTMWRVGRLAGGDAALLIALATLFPTPRFLALLAVTVAVLTVPALAWKYRRDLALALRTFVGAGIRPALDLLRTAVREKAQPAPAAYIFAAAGVVAALVA
jgi:Flp pilus assembly protein protease CpaA